MILKADRPPKAGFIFNFGDTNHYFQRDRQCGHHRCGKQTIRLERKRCHIIRSWNIARSLRSLVMLDGPFGNTSAHHSKGEHVNSLAASNPSILGGS